MNRLQEYEKPAVEGIINYLHRMLTVKLGISERFFQIHPPNVHDRDVLFLVTITKHGGKDDAPDMKLLTNVRRAAERIFNPETGLERAFVDGNQVALSFKRAYFADEDIVVYAGRNFDGWRDDGIIQ